MVRRAFDILGIEITKDTRAIKKAYALLSKQYHPEEHPAEWEKLYGAYQAALEYAQTAGELPENEYGNGSSGKGGAATGTEGDGFAGGGGSGAAGETYFDEYAAEAEGDAFSGGDAAGLAGNGFSGENGGAAGAAETETAAGEPVSVSSNATYGTFFQDAQEQWLRKKHLREQFMRQKLRELVSLRWPKAVKAWQQFFDTDLTMDEDEEILLLLLEAIRENALSEKVFYLIMTNMNSRLRFYAEMGDNDRALAAMEIVKYCSGQIPLLHRKAESRKKWIGIPAALAAVFFLLAMTGLHQESVTEGDVSALAAEYLNEKYGVSDYTAAELEAEKIQLIGSNQDRIDSYEVREPESGNIVAYAMRDIEEAEGTFACFDNLQESEIKDAFEKRLNALTGHEEGRLFWDSSFSDSLSGGLEDGFFHTKYEGDFDAFIRQETKERTNAPGVMTSFLISDYCSLNGLCDYYLPDPEVETMRERFALTDDTEDPDLQAALRQGAADYQLQIRGVILPKKFFQEKTEQAEGKRSGIYVLRDVHGTLGMEPLISFLMLTGWYVNLSPEDEKLLNISSGMYMQPVISMGEGIYGAESTLRGQAFDTDPAWVTGSMVKTENPDSLGLTEEEKEKAVSFRLGDGYALKNDYCLAIDKELYGIADADYRVMVTKQNGFSMDLAGQHLEAEDGTALEKYVSSYGEPGAALKMGDVLDGEGYLFIEYRAADMAEEADIITVINP